jgi:hypothetical protein
VALLSQQLVTLLASQIMIPVFFVPAAQVDPKLAALLGGASDLIVCKSGKVFKNVSQNKSAATGTPGRLMYENYIGTMAPRGPKQGPPGSFKRIDFCDGPCEMK